MIFNQELNITKILEIVEEARKHNYPEQVLIYDLNNYIGSWESSLISTFNQTIDAEVTAAVEDTKEECYEDAFEDGKQEGINECAYELVESFVKMIIELKQDIKQFNLSVDDIQKRLTTNAYEIDKDDDFTNIIENVVKEIDVE